MERERRQARVSLLTHWVRITRLSYSYWAWAAVASLAKETDSAAAPLKETRGSLPPRRVGVSVC